MGSADMHWQVQEAKQRFSEVVRRAQTDGAQFVTKHGHEVVVVLDIEEYRKLHGQRGDFKDYLRAGPHTDELVISRAKGGSRVVDLSDPQ